MTQSALEAEVHSIAERKIRSALRARQERFAYTVAGLHGGAVKAGGLGGSAHQQSIRYACSIELRDRFRAAWEIVRSIAIDFSLPRTRGLGEELKLLIRSLVIESTPDLKQAIKLARQGAMEPDADGRSDLTTLFQETVSEVEAEIDQFISVPRINPEAPAQVEQAPIDQRKVFLSHAASDAQQANVLKEETERRLRGVSVFCSSYPGDIPLGFRWSPEIQRNLQQSGTLILLATTQSVRRPWVWFESGSFWFSRPIIICCLGGLRPDDLPPPLGERQALTLATPEDLRLLLRSVSKITGVSATDETGLDLVIKGLSEINVEAQLRADADQGWVGVPWEGRFLICEGPIEELNLIDPESFQKSMQIALEAEGFQVALIRRDEVGEFKDRGRKPVYATDKKKWRREVQKGDMILVAQPRQKP